MGAASGEYCIDRRAVPVFWYAVDILQVGGTCRGIFILAGEALPADFLFDGELDFNALLGGEEDLMSGLGGSALDFRRCPPRCASQTKPMSFNSFEACPYIR